MAENKEVNSTDPKREKVRVIPLSAIDDALDHPFGVRDDEEMAELVESISTFGVINPVIVRKGDNLQREHILPSERAKGISLSVDEIANSTFYKSFGNYADALIMMLIYRRQFCRKFVKTFWKEYSFFRISYLDFCLIIRVISSKDTLKLLLSVFIIEI